MYYSKSTGGFYTKEIHTTIPPDAVEITDAEWRALLQGEREGKVISADVGQKPSLTDKPAPAPQPVEETEKLPATITRKEWDKLVQDIEALKLAKG